MLHLLGGLAALKTNPDKHNNETPNLTSAFSISVITLDSERLDSCFGCYLLKASSNTWSNPYTSSFTRSPYVFLLLAFGNRRLIPFCVVCHFVVFLFKSIYNNMQHLIFLLPKSVGGGNHSLPRKNVTMPRSSALLDVIKAVPRCVILEQMVAPSLSCCNFIDGCKMVGRFCNLNCETSQWWPLKISWLQWSWIYV